jgi:hypothetical protein
LKIDSNASRTLKLLTAMCGAFFCLVSFVLTSFGIDLSATIILIGTAYSVVTIVAYEEIVYALLRQARYIKLLSSIMIKVALLISLFVLARGGSAQAVISALLGVFSFIPATLFSVLRHKGEETPA